MNGLLVLLILKAESLLFLDLILNENLSVLVQLHLQSNAVRVIIIPQSMGGNYIATALWFYFLFKITEELLPILKLFFFKSTCLRTRN